MTSTNPQPELPERPFTYAAAALISAIEEAHKRGLTEGEIKDLWISGIETLRIVCVTDTLISLSDNKRYPDSTLRGTLTAMLTRAIVRAKQQLDKFALLTSVILPE